MFDLTTIQLNNELRIRQEISRRLNLPKPTMTDLICSINDVAKVKDVDPIDVLDQLSQVHDRQRKNLRTDDGCF